MTLPKDIDINTWWASLVVDFPNDDIPFLHNPVKEDASSWKQQGSFLIEENTFADNGAALPTGANAQEWAQAVFRCMANF
jgi:hypothetical protein